MQVVEFLTERHGNNFLIINLSERPYDYSKFNNQVRPAVTTTRRRHWLPRTSRTLTVCANVVGTLACPALASQVMEFGFPDHHAPPLDVLWAVCHCMDAWLSLDERNVAVVHCKAGKVCGWGAFTGALRI